MKTELKWWIDNLSSQHRVIDHGNAGTVITADASLSGWGGVCNGETVGGRWKEMSQISTLTAWKCLQHC